MSVSTDLEEVPAANGQARGGVRWRDIPWILGFYAVTTAIRSTPARPVVAAAPVAPVPEGPPVLPASARGLRWWREVVYIIAFYLVCIGVTWWHYARKNAPMPC